MCCGLYFKGYRKFGRALVFIVTGNHRRGWQGVVFAQLGNG